MPLQRRILHKELLLRLIADCDHLLRLIEQHGFRSDAQGVTGADLNATLQNRRAAYRGWHEPMPTAQKAQILREVSARVKIEVGEVASLT
jgi:hypothetical protein